MTVSDQNPVDKNLLINQLSTHDLDLCAREIYVIVKIVLNDKNKTFYDGRHRCR